MNSPMILLLLINEGFTATYAFNKLKFSEQEEKSTDELNKLVEELEVVDQEILLDLAKIHFKNKIVSFAIRNEIMRRKRKEEDQNWRALQECKNAAFLYMHLTKKK